MDPTTVGAGAGTGSAAPLFPPFPPLQLLRSAREISEVCPPSPSMGGLYLSAYKPLRDASALASRRIRLVVQCAAELRGELGPVASTAIALELASASAPSPGAGAVGGGGASSFSPSMALLELDLEDATHQDLGEAFSVALPRIAETRRAGGNVLVNCVQGVSRSASIVFAHLLEDAAFSPGLHARDGAEEGRVAAPEGAPVESGPLLLASALSPPRRSLRDAFLTVRERRPIVLPNLSFFAQLLAKEFELSGTCSIAPRELLGHPNLRFTFPEPSAALELIESKLAAVKGYTKAPSDGAAAKAGGAPSL